jgi:hypothetical protein
MNFTVMHDDMPDRNYAFYPGMLEGGDGLIGRRGASVELPAGGPLIATAARVEDIYADGKTTNTGYSGQQTFEDSFKKGPPRATTTQNNEQQYIDQLYDNRSTGEEREFEVNPNRAAEEEAIFATDLVF